MKTEWIETKKLKKNPKNPRVIRDDAFQKLVNSIKEFPKMLEIRPIVIDKKFMVLGGNQRLEAVKVLGLEKVPIIKADTLTKEEQERFILADNVSFGEWDFDLLKGYDPDLIKDFNIDLIELDDFSEKNKEINVVEFSDNMILKFSYPEKQYNQIKQALSKIDESPEKALWKLANGKA